MTTINRDEIHIWRLELNHAPQEMLSTSELLTAEELQRGSRLVHDSLRRRFWGSHGFLRLILSDYLDIHPREIEFNKSAYGKPWVHNPKNYRFNLSHSGDWVVCAVAVDQEVGIDIEQINTNLDYLALAARFFETDEYDYLLNLTPADRLIGFYRIWVRKEAYLKAHGVGLSGFLGNINVLDQNTNPIIDLSADTGYACALAVTERKNVPINTIEYRFIAQTINS